MAEEELPEEKTYPLDDTEREELKAARRRRRLENRRQSTNDEELEAMQEAIDEAIAEVKQINKRVAKLYEIVRSLERCI